MENLIKDDFKNLSENDKKYRIEVDSTGEYQIPINAKYGVQTAKARDNFKITGRVVDPLMTKAMAEVKKACAITNNEIGLLNDDISEAIIRACNAIIDGQYLDEFVTDPIQGGAGTSTNMNANEVIAHLATEYLQDKNILVDPNDHVNLGQSTNDTYPTAGRITIIRLLTETKKSILKLKNALEEKADEFDKYIKIGRTQLQDAVPIRLGQEFRAYAEVTARDYNRLGYAWEDLLRVNLGGTAIGTGLNADKKYLKSVVPNLSIVTKLPLRQAENLIDATQNLDDYTFLSSKLKCCAVNLSKICNDLRLMGSGPICGINEITLPTKQAGSSIMPGKVNPVIPEVVNQVCFRIAGNDVTIAMAVEGGQFELNAFEPVIFYSLIESLRCLKGACDTLRENCIEGIIPNIENMKQEVEKSLGIITAASPHIGYKNASKIVKEALKSGESIRYLLKKEKLLTDEEMNQIFHVEEMTEPGIAAFELFKEKQIKNK